MLSKIVVNERKIYPSSHEKKTFVKGVLRLIKLNAIRRSGVMIARDIYIGSS